MNRDVIRFQRVKGNFLLKLGIRTINFILFVVRLIMGFTLSLRIYECLRMSEVVIATKSRDSAQSIVSFELRTFLRILTFLTLE